MWGEQCPVHAEIRPWFKDTTMEDIRKYWKKRSHIFQGFVTASDMQEDSKPENPSDDLLFTKFIKLLVQH